MKKQYKLSLRLSFFVASLFLFLMMAGCTGVTPSSLPTSDAGASPIVVTPTLPNNDGAASPIVVTPTAPAPSTTPTPSASQGNFAAYVANSGGAIVQHEEQEYGNSTTIYSAVDRPAAFISQPYLSVPPLAKGEVLIQNDSANPQTLVSDTADGFASFTIAPYTSTTLIFTRAGNFRSHLQAYPDVTLTIFISMPYSG
jgi:hypothetical protein